MRRSVLCATLVCFIASGHLAFGQEADAPAPTSDTPLKIDKVERETVRLVLVDVLVLDRQDRTVSGLVADDFQVFHDGDPVKIESVDEYCDEGGRPEPDAVRFARERTPTAAPPGGRRFVLTMDYQHIGFTQRAEVFDHARKWLEHELTDDDQVMLAALTGGVRVEQSFTGDRARILGSLKRMEHDITLWNGNFSHLNETGWVRGMTALLDIVEQSPGRKAMVLYSSMTDVPLDLQFDQIAAQAAASRCAIYPVDAAGLRLIDNSASRVAPPPGAG